MKSPRIKKAHISRRALAPGSVNMRFALSKPGVDALRRMFRVSLALFLLGVAFAPWGGTKNNARAESFRSPTTSGSVAGELVQGLHQRRLFHLAEVYCRDRLKAKGLTPAERAELTVELIRSLSRHALHSLPAERPARWRAAHEVARRFVRNHPDDPQRVFVELQDILTILARGELARMEAEVSAPGAPSLAEARQQLRQAIEAFRKLDDQLSARIRKRHREGIPRPGTQPSDPLSADELLSVQNHVRYQWARARKNQALCYPPRSDDRIAALQQALQILRPLAQLPGNQPLTWKSRVDQIICLRLLEDFKNTARALKNLDALKPPPSIMPPIRAEKIRLMLATGDPKAILPLLQQGRVIAGQTSPELDFAYLETYIALWHAAEKAKDAKMAKAYQDKASRVIQILERLHGPYWQRRAETLLAASAATVGGAGNLDLLVRTAANYYQRHQFDDAVAAYNRAARYAQTAHHFEKAFDLFFTAAAIEHQQNRHQEAMTRFRTLALKMPRHVKASEAHLLAVVNASLWAREKKPLDLTIYGQLLEEHVANWPRGPAANKAWWWLARLREQQQKWGDAFQAYQHIPPRSPHHAEAIHAAARCCEHWFAKLKKEGRPYGKQGVAAAGYFEDVILVGGTAWPKEWRSLDQFAALQAATIWIRHTTNGRPQASRILQAMLAHPKGVTNQSKLAARLLLVEALFDPNSQDRNHAREVLKAIRGLQRYRKELSKAQRRSLDTIYAKSLATDGQWPQADQVYATLASQNPNDASIQEGYGEFLLRAPSRKLVEKARDQWRRILRRSPPQTDQWYRAKYKIAAAHFRLGEKEKAAKLIQYLMALHPNLGNDKTRQAEFQSLLNRCKQ